jgi:neutral ceramidase
VVRQRPALGVHDRLYARALALDDGRSRCCLVMLDLIGVDRDLTRAIRRATAAPQVTVAVVATHTHGGPPILSGAGLGPVDPAYRARVVRDAARAAADALADLRPATLRLGVGHDATIGRNRRDEQGPIDPDVAVLRVDRDGALAGLLVSYACHPVTLGPDNLLLTRDYPGALVDELERRHPGAVAAFAPGCCGQIGTGHRAEDSFRSGAASGRTFAEAERIGRSLAATATAAAAAALAGPPLAGPLRIAISAVDLPLAPPPARTDADRAAWSLELSRLAGDDDRAAMLRALLAWADGVARAPRRRTRVEAICIGLGDACLALYPGEVFVEFALALKAAFPRRRVVTIACANAAPGYLPHASAYPAGGYEVDEAYRFYAQPGPFPPEAGERLQAAMLDLAQQVLP